MNFEKKKAEMKFFTKLKGGGVSLRHPRPFVIRKQANCQPLVSNIGFNSIYYYLIASFLYIFRVNIQF